MGLTKEEIKKREEAKEEAKVKAFTGLFVSLKPDLDTRLGRELTKKALARKVKTMGSYTIKNDTGLEGKDKWEYISFQGGAYPVYKFIRDKKLVEKLEEVLLDKDVEESKAFVFYKSLDELIVVWKKDKEKYQKATGKVLSIPIFNDAVFAEEFKKKLGM